MTAPHTGSLQARPLNRWERKTRDEVADLLAEVTEEVDADKVVETLARRVVWAERSDKQPSRAEEKAMRDLFEAADALRDAVLMYRAERVKSGRHEPGVLRQVRNFGVRQSIADLITGRFGRCEIGGGGSKSKQGLEIMVYRR
jgi:hypothetical protein